MAPAINLPNDADVSELLEPTIAGLAAGFGVAAPIGAITVLLISLAARVGLVAATAGALGVATVDGCYAAVATLGGAAVRPYLAPLGTPLRWTAAVVLLGIAIRTARGALAAPADMEPGLGGRAETADGPRSPTPTTSADETPTANETATVHGTARAQETVADTASRTTVALRTYASFVGLTALNPFTILSFTAIILGRQVGTTPSPLAQTVFVLAVATASAGWNMGLVAAGRALGRVLTGRRGRRATALVSAAVIAVLALRMLLPVG